MTEDLAAFLESAWTLLRRGAAERRSPCHAPALATVGLDGRPRLRVVVLRAVEPSALRLRVHTDARSEKAAEIAADPRVALLAYDPGAKLQIRVEGRASLHADDALAQAAWDASKPMSRVCYGTSPAPGSPIPEGGAFRLPETPDAVAAGRANFVAIAIAARTAEVLHLAHGGHRRAAFDLAEGTGRWLVP